MERDFERMPCCIMRGGTSRGLFLKSNHLPADPARRDAVILDIFGSPDVRQIDGLGGADPLTSKLAVVGPPTRPDADVDYTFAQVGIDRGIVDYTGNCGNISSAVGPFAINEGLVRAVEPVTTVRIHNTNTGRLLVAEVPVLDGQARTAMRQPPAVRTCPSSTGTSAASSLPVLVLWMRTVVTDSTVRTSPSLIAKGPTAEEMLPQLPV